MIVLRVIKVDFELSITYLLKNLMHQDFGIKVSQWHSVSKYAKTIFAGVHILYLYSYTKYIVYKYYNLADNYFSSLSFFTRVCVVTVSVFTQCWVGDGFNSQPKPRHS